MRGVAAPRARCWADAGFPRLSSAGGRGVVPPAAVFFSEVTTSEGLRGSVVLKHEWCIAAAPARPWSTLQGLALFFPRAVGYAEILLGDQEG